VTTIEKGKYPHLFVAFLSEGCYHCAEPSCASACPVDAITKRDSDGVVMVDREKCQGDDCNRVCLDACPHNVPQFGAENNAKMQKCEFCLDRWAEGKLPICVGACPTRAMDAGPLEEMEAKYGRIKEAVGFTPNEKIGPAVVFKPKPEVYPKATVLP
jgi:anaerobic dimethyl sulfoxide reductase subunit B (iron-sulfur subunit)